jgi:hypothetical protein
MGFGSMLDDIEEENRASVKDWVQKTFTRRECVKYVGCKSFRDKCGCGRRLDEHRRFAHSNSYSNGINATGASILDQFPDHHHHQETSQQSNNTNNAENQQQKNGSKLVWKIQDNTETFPTNAFGTLEFQGPDVHTKKAEVSLIIS